MAEYPALHLWTDALLGDVQHLSTTEFGAYMMTLIVAWRSEGCRLPDDEKYLARITRAGRNWPRIRSVVMSFWRLREDGFWYQKRLTKEHLRAADRALQARTAGKASALKRQDTAPTSVGGELPLEYQREANPLSSSSVSKSKAQLDTPTELNLETPILIPTAAPLNFFDHEFWPAYPRKQDKKDAKLACGKALKRALPEVIMRGVENMKASSMKPDFYPHPTTFLNGNRWEDEWGPPRKDQGAIDAIKALTEGEIKNGFPAHDAIDRLVEAVALPAPAGVVRKAGED